jgi:hypothetical protein
MTECGGSKPKQQHLAFLGDDFDDNIRNVKFERK